MSKEEFYSNLVAIANTLDRITVSGVTNVSCLAACMSTVRDMIPAFEEIIKEDACLKAEQDNK